MVQHIIRADIFELRSIFPRPPRAKKKYDQWAKCPLVLYAKPSNKSFIITLKNIVILQLASIFWVRAFRNILIPSVRVTLTMSKMFTRNICQTIEWEVNYSTAKKKKILLVSIFYFIFASQFFQFSHGCSFCISRYSPCCKPVKPGHYSVLRPRILAFSWPYMLKWRSSRIIDTMHFLL